MNEAVIPPEVLKDMQAYEIETGMPPKEQVTAMAAYWFRLRKINDDRN